MLGIVTALDSAFAAQLYVRFTTLSHSGRCIAPPNSPSPDSIDPVMRYDSRRTNGGRCLARGVS